MKIVSLIRPTQTKPGQQPARTVKVFGKDYVFRPEVDGSFVADVDDPAAIECLLKLPKAYREFIAPAPVLARGLDVADPAAVKAAQKAADEQAAKEKEAAVKADAAVKDQEAREDETARAAQVEADVLALLSSTPQAIKKIVEKHPPTREVLEKALANEKSQEKPRQQVVNLLSGTLASIGEG